MKTSRPTPTPERLLLAVAVIVLTGCASGAPAGGSQRGGDAPRVASEAGPRTLKMVVRYEVSDLASKISGPSSPSLTRRAFNAALALADGKGDIQPYLASALPQLDTESWRVFPDGRME